MAIATVRARWRLLFFLNGGAVVVALGVSIQFMCRGTAPSYPWLFLVRLNCHVVFAAQAAGLQLGSTKLVWLIARIRRECFLLFDRRLFIHVAVAIRISFFGSFAACSQCWKIVLIFRCPATGALILAFGFVFRRHWLETNSYKLKKVVK